MKELALHILDIAENSISAGAKNITISVSEDLSTDILAIKIEDDGRGMDEDTLKTITDPFTTSRTTRKVGLGIPLLKAAAESCNGNFDIWSKTGSGTKVALQFQHSHIDRMPTGDLSCTYLTLLVGSPEVHWIFEYHYNEKSFIVDDQPIKKELDGISFSEPSVLKFLREYLQEGILSLQNQPT